MGKRKTMTRKISAVLAAILILTVVPSTNASAKTIDISKFVGKSAVQIAASLNLKASENPYIKRFLYTPKGKGMSEPVCLSALTGYEDRANCWNFSLEKKDSGMRIYGVEPKMERKKAHKILLKKGWKCEKGYKWTDPVVNYENSKGYGITIHYKNEKKNAKVQSMGFSPETPDLYQ